jgi:hypothetical protein
MNIVLRIVETYSLILASNCICIAPSSNVVSNPRKNLQIAGVNMLNVKNKPSKKRRTLGTIIFLKKFCSFWYNPGRIKDQIWYITLGKIIYNPRYAANVS